MSRDEVDAFRLRQLQSRLMVAALACNQSVAYNTFVEHFRPSLAASGAAISGYFQRTGGGEAALNGHITDLANAAGLSRATAPHDFCSQTWSTFLLLEDEPEELPIIAASHQLSDIQRPQECAVVEKADGGDAVVPTAPAASELPVIKISTSAP